MMEISQACASTAVIMAVTNMVVETIVHFGSQEQKQRYVPEITSGRVAAASYALSEPHTGSDAAALSTNARRRRRLGPERQQAVDHLRRSGRRAHRLGAHRRCRDAGGQLTS